MILQTFLFLPGINEKTEHNIWNQGIKDWHDFLNAKSIKGISAKRKGYYDRKILEARKELYNTNSAYFADKLPRSEHWRLYDFFKEDTCFLDIETSGVEKGAYITIVGLFDGINTKTMVRNKNMDFKALKKELQHYKLICTFNGSSFDIPFLEKIYPDLIPKLPHMDLRHLCARIGLKGGLKQIEKELGIKRTSTIVERMYGGDAIKLWRTYLATGDEYYLKLLIEYNEEDIINLKQIANIVCGKLKKSLA